MIVASNNVYNFITQEKPRPFTVTEGETAGTVIVSPGKCFFNSWKIPTWSNLASALGDFNTEKAIQGTKGNPDILSLLIQFEDNTFPDEPAELPYDPDEEAYNPNDVHIGWYGREANEWPIDRVTLSEETDDAGQPLFELHTSSFQGKGYIPIAKAYLSPVEGEEPEVIIEQLIDYNPILPMETRVYTFKTSGGTTTYSPTTTRSTTTTMWNQTSMNEFADP